MSSEDDNGEGQKEEEAAAIIEAARVYHNYFIPVHQDGRTASEFAGLAPPGWLSSLIAEHREARLSPSEERIVRDDPMLFSGMLTAEMLTGIAGDGGTTKRSKVVLMIMGALEDAHRREELERAERWNGAKGTGTEAGPSAAVPADVGMDEGEWEEEAEEEDEANPEVVVPFVTVYSTKNKARTRALLQTYREDSSTVSFHGVACKVSLEKGEEDDHMFAAYSSYPVEGGEEEAKGRARLGVIRLDGDHVELSSTVEERHRALRGFFLKLVGERDVKVVSVVRDAVLNQTTDELANPDMGEALSLIKGMTPDEILKEGLVISLAVGILTHRAKDEGNGKKDEDDEKGKKDAITLLPSPPFIRSILQSYRELVAERPRESKGEGLREAIFKNTLEAVKAAREGLDDDEDDDGLSGTAGFETSVALIAFFAIIEDLARTDGEKVAAAAIDRISNQRSLKDTHVRELIRYLERFAATRRPPTI